MSDYFDSAQSNIDDRKRATLEAMARAGTDGKKAYEDEIARIQAQKQQAITAALAAAAQRGAPQQVNDQIAQQIASGYDHRTDDLRGSLASRDAGSQAVQGANAAYFDQASAAIPAMRARADRQLEDIRAKAAEAEQQRQQQLMLSQLQLQRAGLDNATAAQKAQTSAATAKAKAAAGDKISDSELRTRLLGAAKVQTDKAPAAVKNLSVFGVKLPQLSQAGIAQNLGSQAGLDPARVAGVLLPKTAAKAPAPAKPTQTAHQTDVTARVQKFASPSTYETFLNIVAGEPASTDEHGNVLKAVPPVKSLAEALKAANAWSDADLKSQGISRASLVGWLKDYFSV